jgi:hypothetical protein
MSIVTSTNLQNLWGEAQREDAHENKAIAFWQHYFSKIAFPEEHWIVSTEVDPAVNSRRRVDLAIRFSDSRDELRVLCFFEGKKHSASPEEILESERQALDACRKYLDSHDQHNIYAVTARGTRAKAWLYEKNDTSLSAMDPQVDPRDSRTAVGYIEAHSSEAAKLTAAFNRMKLLPPAMPASAQRHATADVPHQQQPETHSQQLPRPSSTTMVQSGSRHAYAVGTSAQETWTEVEFRRNPENTAVGQFMRGDSQWENIGRSWRRGDRDGRVMLVNDADKLFLYIS